jgi:hypothetical protein
MNIYTNIKVWMDERSRQALQVSKWCFYPIVLAFLPFLVDLESLGTVGALFFVVNHLIGKPWPKKTGQVPDLQVSTVFPLQLVPKPICVWDIYPEYSQLMGDTCDE